MASQNERCASPLLSLSCRLPVASRFKGYSHSVKATEAPSAHFPLASIVLLKRPLPRISHPHLPLPLQRRVIRQSSACNKVLPTYRKGANKPKVDDLLLLAPYGSPSDFSPSPEGQTQQRLVHWNCGSTRLARDSGQMSTSTRRSLGGTTSQVVTSTYRLCTYQLQRPRQPP